MKNKSPKKTSRVSKPKVTAAKPKRLSKKASDTNAKNIATPKKIVNQAVGQDQTLTSDQFIVQGVITQNGRPSTGVIVRAYDKDLRREAWLGETISKEGYYEIAYHYDNYAHAEYGNADLFIRIYDAKENLLGTSDIAFNAPPLLELNYAISAKSSWEKLNDALLPLLSAQKKVDYQPSEEYENLPPYELKQTDLQFLSNETGIAVESIRKWASAYASAQAQPEIQEVIFYGWFVMGMPERIADLWKQSVKQLLSVLLQAIEKDFIPASVEKLLKKIQSDILRLQQDEKNAPLLEDVAILSASFGDNQDLLSSFTKTYLQENGDWSAIKPMLSSFPDEIRNKIFFHHELMTWSNKNTALMETFRKDDATSSLRNIALKHSRESLNKIIPDSVVPSSETKETFVENLYNALYTLQPSAVLINMINDQGILFWTNEMDKLVSGTLSKAEEYNIKTTSIYEVIHNADAFSDIAKDKIEEVKRKLKALQRITLLSPVPEAVPALIKNNYLSSYTITALPIAQFIATMQVSELPYETLQYIYAEAEKKKAFYEHVLVTIKEAGEQTGIAIIDGNVGKPENGSNGSHTIPAEVQHTLANNNLSWELLFGDADFCECGECTSVYSAAAYYVELLQYLRNNNLDPEQQNPAANDITNTPLALLFARRPDLGYLELTCKNTNTILPYVDLVNEVMEQYIAFPLRHVDFESYEGFNVDDETSGELLSAPQHTEQDETYQALQNAYYPFSLPYHQPIDAARIFLKQLNTSRHEVIDTFRGSDSGIPFATAADAEFLELTEEQYRILTRRDFAGTPDQRATEEFYGLKNVAGWTVKLSSVKDEFLPRTGISYAALTELVKTEYINPGLAVPEYITMLKSLSQTFADAWLTHEDDMGGTLLSQNPNLEILLEDYDESIRQRKLDDFFSAIAKCIILDYPSNHCTLENVKLVRCNLNELEEDEFDRLHRFIRLWRKLGVTIDETDSAIMILGDGSITPDLIHKLVAVKKIIALTGLELTKALCLWGDIRNTGENSLYKQLFQTHNLVRMDDVFATDLTGDEKISAHLPAIMAALNLSANDISLIVTYKSLPDEPDLTLEILSLFYRYRLASKALGLRVGPFIELVEVAGNIFEDPDATLWFLKNAAKAEEAGFSINQLSYVVNGQAGVDNTLIPTKKEVLVLAKKIYDGQNAIETEHADIAADPSAITDDQKLQSRKNQATSELVRSKAALLYEADEVEKIISLLEGTAIATEKDEIFNDLLAGIFEGHAAAAGIIKSADTASSSPEKRLTFLTIFLPFLREELIQAHVVNTLSEHLSLDKLIVQSLIMDILKVEQFSLYDHLTASTALPAPVASADLSWYGKLIPASDDDFTFIVNCNSHAAFEIKLDHEVVLTHEATHNAPAEVRSIEKKLQSGKVYQVSMEGIEMKDLYWKTKTSSVEAIPDKVFLPDFKKKATRASLEHLERMAILVKTLSLSADELTYIHAHAADFNNINFSDLSFYHLLRLIDYCHLRDSLPNTAVNFLQFWERLEDATSTLSEQIADLTKWKKEIVDQLISSAHYNLAKADFKNEKKLLKLQRALTVVDKLGIDINRLFEWAKPSSDFDVCRTIANSIQQSFRAKYNQADWEQVVKPLNDLLRDNQKNAMIDYLLQLPELKDAGVTDANGLFEYFLIDVQMGTCMETSRIKQAISSVQLFIQRCFLGLEKKGSVDPANILSKARWEWMQRYRVWEANRKVFLYPENWIESNLRDDKSPFFKELESELLQKDINKENATDALTSYLYKVDEVANMEVVGLYVEGEKNQDLEWPQGSKLHVFSRTRTAPYFFYYRYLALDEMNWYPWEKVQVDIPCYDVTDSNGRITGNGCYLSPIIWRSRLLIFFPQFLKKTRPKSSGKISALAEENSNDITPYEYWEIKISWSEYRNGKWTQKQIGRNVDQTHVLSTMVNPALYAARDQVQAALVVLQQKRIEKRQRRDAAKRLLDFAIDEGLPNNIINARRTNYQNKEQEYQAALAEIETAQADLVRAQAAIDNASPIPIEALGDIQRFEFVPEISDDDRLTVNVLYKDRLMGVVGFNSNTSTAIPTNAGSNLISPTYFHYENFQISSLQTNGSHGFHFNRTSTSITLNGEKFFHPYTATFLGRINSTTQESFFSANPMIGSTQDDIDDVFGGRADNDGNNVYHELKKPYSIYNWELFFHTPMMLANALSKAQQFEAAANWFHYVFNPLTTGSAENRFWRFIPFKETDSKNILDQIFNGLQANEPNTAINEWRNNPFKPHLVARSRPVAYMKWVVMKYIDNIFDWGDYLFRQDTIESINQATQLYILAGHILGPKPMKIPKRGETKVHSYRSLLDKWDAFSNAISELEVAAIYNTQTSPYASTNENGTAATGIFGSASALYFCIPKNPRLMAYWDTLADRLSKIRSCQNIDGVFRKLPLFEPPIDPALLVKAAAQGLSISSVINDLNTPMPNYRFYYLLQKALELCGELKSLGNALLSAMEKKDGESISLIRAKHEGTMNNLMMEIKKLQHEEAKQSLESLKENRKGPAARMKYYLQLVGEKDESKIPAEGETFTELANTIEAPVDESGLKLSRYEKEDVDKATAAQDWQRGIGIVETTASIMHLIPELFADVKPFGIGAGTKWGGINLGNAMQAVARGLQVHASDLSFASTNASKKGGFQRAMQERIFQANAAGYELKQIDKQITAQQIRIDIADQEIRNQQHQIDNANEVEDFLKNKYTNEELYTWMRGSLKTLYRQVYNLAYDLAKKAEKTYCFERGISQANFIQAGYFDAGREGLLAGEQLYVGLKQLEVAYQEKRGYDYEITKHISLRQLDPFALLQLKVSGGCQFSVPEVLFDMDYPGHFKRRIKSVSVSIPCIAGPHTGVNATLRLLNNRFRNSAIANNYPEKMDEQDDRFVSYHIPITAIAASSAQNDAGMFELNFKDERYLPFEGAGVISNWGLELPPVRQFDYNSIADVVLHVRYTSSEGGGQLKNSAQASVINQLNAVIQQLNETGLHIPISLKHDMPNEWNLLKQNRACDINIGTSRLPYFVQGLSPEISAVKIISKSNISGLNTRIKGDPEAEEIALAFSPLGTTGLFQAEVENISFDTGFTLSRSQSSSSLDELVLLIKIIVRQQ